MTTITEHVVDVIQELTRLQGLPAPYIESDDDFPIPGMIDAGNGGSLIVSRRLDRDIATIADRLMAADPTLAPRYTRADWRASVRRAFGPALVAIDLDNDPAENADAVLAAVNGTLTEQESAHGVREFAFGCTLFGNTPIQPFTIGPVRFEARLDWLARKNHDGGLSDVTRRRVQRSWEGKRPRKRKLTRDSIDEREIRDAADDCPCMCSVAINGLAAEAGREKALTAARLAMTAMALLWRTPSRALEGMNLLFDRNPHRRKTLTFFPGEVVHSHSSWSYLPQAYWLKAGEWEETFARNRDLFVVVSEILAYVVSPSGAATRPEMMNTLTHALLWFHEGCREPVSLMAVVNFSSALDALGSGDGARGIRRLITARLGIKDEATIRRDGPTLKQAIAEIYGEGRSRTVHGTNKKLSHDWSGTRGVAEHFARLCLLACLDWAADNPSSDEPSQLSK